MMIDEGSRFRVARLLSEKGGDDSKSQQLIRAFEELWKPVFGIPAKMRVDPQGIWWAKALEAYFEAQHVELGRIPAEAHWQASHVRRVEAEHREN